ncbi:hypothetical protein ABZ721_29005 [Streptomyces sp. NPDC006733]|uniref:thioesterase family protein n=1 Tax=Streptomyces sp. NPDC006733 TaxID=3155460 RepID=UPI0033E35C99
MTTRPASPTAAAGTRTATPAPDLTALVGTSATLTHTVSAEDSAGRWGNDIDVLATPVLLWLSEIAAMRVLGDAVADPWMTVGLHHDTGHLAPTPTGEDVHLTARLTHVDGKKLTFEVEGRDSRATVLRGTHQRAVIDRGRFLAGLADRLPG